ncbi:MAG TPA: hypothetical protein VF503_20715 [Sphingobium sp.]|uniref:hypothetical protein n=1 Tax=Sphingobium sp. TaxID=1912891 RepID=UPI002ED4EBD6
MTAKCNWTRLRKSLRNFSARSGWSAAQIAKAMREEYGYMARVVELELLLDPDWRDPRNALGYQPFTRFLMDNSNNTPLFEDWLARRKARVPKPIWAEADAISAQAISVEQQRAARVRELLAQEPRHCGRLVVQSDDPLAGLDAASIAALSGGTIIMRGAGV